MSLVTFPRQFLVDINGKPRVGAKANFYQSGTSTPITVWTTPAYNVPLTNPVMSVAGGLFPAIYVDPAVNATYKVVITDSADSGLYSEDNVTALGFTQRDIAQLLTPTTEVEGGLGITPVDYSKLPGDPERYAENTTPGTTDMTTAFQSACDQLKAGGAPVAVGPGTFLLTDTLLYQLPDPTTTQQPGLIMRGSGMFRTIIKSSKANAPAIKISITDDSVMFQNGVLLSDFSLRPSGAPAVQHGLQLGGVYSFRIERVQIQGFSGHGIYEPNLDATFPGGPDAYSVVFGEIYACQITQNTLHGIWSEMGAAFIVSIRDTSINLNVQGGVYLAGGGAGEIAGCSISYNGTDGNGYGGLTLARSTGAFASAVQTIDVERVEFDRNRNYHVRVGGLTCGSFEQNRFISADEVATTAHVPPTHISFALVASASVGDVRFARNFHRRADAAYALVTYDLGNDANVTNIELVGNRWASTSNTTKYANIHASSRVQIEDTGVIRRTNLGGSFARGRITSGSPTVGTSSADVVWSSETSDPNSALDTATGIYTCPATGVYKVSTGLTLTGLTAADIVTLRLVQNSGGDLTIREVEYRADGSTNFTSQMQTSVFCTVGDTLRLRAFNSAGTKNIRVGDAFNWFCVNLDAK